MNGFKTQKYWILHSKNHLLDTPTSYTHALTQPTFLPSLGIWTVQIPNDIQFLLPLRTDTAYFHMNSAKQILLLQHVLL